MKLLELLSNGRSLWQQQREIRELRAEIEKLRSENERIHQAMRRCLSCDYRLKANAPGR